MPPLKPCVPTVPGVLALGSHTMGFLAKFYAEDMEHVNPGPVDALGSMGANRYQVVTFAIIPPHLSVTTSIY
jgi:phosphonate transport system permease protein